MTKKRTAQLLGELKRLSRESSDNMYRRIEIAIQVLDDYDWIADVHKGSRDAAVNSLAAEFFADIGGFISLGKLMDMHARIDKAAWKEHKFDVAAIEVLYDERSKPERHEMGKRTSWKKIAEERQDRIEQLERQIKELMSSNSQLRDENTELRTNVARLEGRIEEMDRRTARV